MELNVKISNLTLTKTSVIDNIRIRVIGLDLFKSVSVYVLLMCGNTYIDTKNFTLTGTDYTNWGNDDTYITNYIMNALNTTPAALDPALAALEPAALDPALAAIEPAALDPALAAIEPAALEPAALEPALAAIEPAALEPALAAIEPATVTD